MASSQAQPEVVHESIPELAIGTEAEDCLGPSRSLWPPTKRAENRGHMPSVGARNRFLAREPPAIFEPFSLLILRALRVYVLRIQPP